MYTNEYELITKVNEYELNKWNEMNIIIKWIKDNYGKEKEVMNWLWKARLLNTIIN